MLLNGKTIILGAGGSIAAYKMPALVSLLVKEGLNVHPVITKGASHFVTKEALATMSKQRVWSDSFDSAPAGMIPHIDLAKAADFLLIAPASANLLAKIAHGLADDMLTDIVLAATCPKMIVPAMNTHMYENEATQANLEILKRRGWVVMEAAEGLLACGDVGRGKMPDLEEIVVRLKKEMQKEIQVENLQDMKGRRVVVTAGPTQEKIDPVRYITNHSSGKMGYALAEAALARGAEVCLISGPVDLSISTQVELHKVQSAAEMSSAVKAAMKEADVLIMAAAVADFTPVHVSNEKIKKETSSEHTILELKRTEDVLAAVAASKREGQILCGFAMETENLLVNAKKKLETKKLDLICANSLAEKGAGFAVDTNILSIIDAERVEALPLMSKREAAERILDRIVELL